MKQDIYITTSIAYVNGAPHIGFAMELVEADFLARYYAQQGHDVYFLTGTDEHGTKVYRTALEQGFTPQELCDANAEKFKALVKALNISNNDFIRTTESRHKNGAMDLWKKISNKLEKRSFSGLYCAGCEAFITEKELVDGKCPNHLKEPELLEEENWFFRLSDYSKEILEMIKSDNLKISPSFRAPEILKMAEEGFKDVSFSRPKETLPWGVEVPNDLNQVMYVWCDALSNYITALGYGSSDDEKFQKYWNNAKVIHVIGKDILRFHAGYWPSMLLAAGIKTPSDILVHGFLTSEGQKMSKSLGNVVDPFEIIESDGVDALRFFLLKEVVVGRDADFANDRFKEIKNAYLADGLGNLVQRVHKLSERLEIGDFESNIQDEYLDSYNSAKEKMHNAVLNYQLHDAAGACFDFIGFLNQDINQKEPWKIMKQDSEQAKKILFQHLASLAKVAEMIYPLMPQTSNKIKKILNLDENFNSKGALGSSEILFPKD
ncbi:MAG: methionine--tRNA ligase [Candidatus Gracilibacteria bacterium]|jgi:methionyl-tRNA synthetase|nr:methionine--tRNA ligase [Candidatus Gracilibacteria bacterium]